MARKTEAGVALVPDAALDIEALDTMQNLGAVAQGLQDERDLANQLLGQAQMADSFAQFSLTVRTSKLSYVKEHKLYRALKGKKTPDGQGFLSGTWDEYCNLLGRSVAQTDEDIANLRALGEEALESMSKMGIGYRDLRQWRRLPDDARSALIEAAKTDNKEAVIFLAEELIATHTQEKESLTKTLTETKADYDAQGDVLANKSAELDRTKLELEKAKRRIQTLSADEAAKELRQEVIGIAFEAEADISGKLREAFATLAVHAEETGTDHRNFKSGLVHQLERLLADIRTEFHLPENTGGNDLDFFTQPEA